jgi:hypothetical protein
MNWLFVFAVILILVIIGLFKLIKYHLNKKETYFKKLDKWRYKNARKY